MDTEKKLISKVAESLRKQDIINAIAGREAKYKPALKWGAIIGTPVGALIGGLRRRSLPGAMIGAAAGGVLGSGIGALTVGMHNSDVDEKTNIINNLDALYRSGNDVSREDVEKILLQMYPVSEEYEGTTYGSDDDYVKRHYSQKVTHDPLGMTRRIRYLNMLQALKDSK